MSRSSRVAFLVQRIGPYHHARLMAWARSRRGPVAALEFRPGDSVYAWAPVVDAGGYERVVSNSPGELRHQLERLSPAAIVCTGYADPEIRQAVDWGLRQGVPLVTCSDSTRDDEPRGWIKEEIKRLALQPFGAALAAGTRSREYLQRLGIEKCDIFQPWDVVDNRYFARRADEARAAAGLRRSMDLPERYFLCVARFVPKKNLAHLIAVHAHYVAQAGAEAWSLVLSGSGPLEPELRAAVRDAGARVRFTGFLQYPDLPAVYGLAGAFVLPSLSDQWGLAVNEAMAAGLPVLVSTCCGCAPDLVREGENGFTFDPCDAATLAGRMLELTRLDETARAALGRRSQEIVAAYSPEVFAAGAEAAVQQALARGRQRASWLARRLNERLATRAVPVP